MKTRRNIFFLLVLLFTVSIQAQSPTNGILFVKKGATGNGSSWTNALGELADALKYAKQTGGVTQIWVAKGTYKPMYTPEDGKNFSATPADTRDKAFLMVKDVKLYGGFDPDNGITNLTHTRILPAAASGGGTILSGDLDNNNTRSDGDAYHVLVSMGSSTQPITAATVLDGFTITGGNANGTITLKINNIDLHQSFGGGMSNYYSSPTLTNVTLSGNWADYGGGMVNVNSSPTLTNVTLSGNTAKSEGGGMRNHSSSPMLTNVTFSGNTALNGGGMYNEKSSPTLTNVTLSGNRATNFGGGMSNHSSSPMLTNVTFSGNWATNFGGGMNNYRSSPTLTNVTLSGNTANYGGGMDNSYNSSPTLTNVTLSGNGAGERGGGMYNTASSPTLTNVTLSGNWASEGGGMYNLTNSNPKIYNTIILGNNTGVVNSSSSSTSTPEFRYSLVQGVTPPANDPNGNINPAGINASDIFVNWIDPTVTGWTPNSNGDYSLKPTATAVKDKGNDDLYNAVLYGNLDLAGNNRISGCNIDLGAYEIQVLGQPICAIPTNGILFVKKGSTGNGSSWTNALGELADALKYAKQNGGVTQIWVAKGTYKPMYSPADNNFGNNAVRNNSFLLVEGVKLYGGFDPDNGITNLTHTRILPGAASGSGTILSGDLDNDNALSNGDAYHVLVSIGSSTQPITAATVFDGFTITGGNANGTGYLKINNIDRSQGNGAGIFNYYSSPTLTNVTLSGNTARYGGGMYNENSSSPTLTNVTLSGNTGSNGGGMHNDSSSPTLTNVTLSGNTAVFGGGMFNYMNSSPKIYNTIFLGNNTGVHNNNSTPDYRYSLVQDLTPPANDPNGNINPAGINASDIFVNPQAPGLSTAGDYSLKLSATAVIDKGNNTYNTTNVDLAGNLRIVGAAIDLGAFESQATPNSDGILHVKKGATGKGSSWANALGELADALKYAKQTGRVTQIWVAKGTYKPMYSPADDNFDKDAVRDNSFLLVKGVKLYGGFDPDNGITNLTHTRILPANASDSGTILSGDLDNDNTLSDGDAYHVLVSIGSSTQPITAATVLDGFTITGGNANGTGSLTINNISLLRGYGGGMYNENSSPTLTNLTLSGNKANFGGGMLNRDNSSPTLTNVTLSGNTAISGGGMSNGNSSPRLTNVTLSGNAATSYGGGMYNNSSSSPTLTNVTLSGNTATYNGGGMYNYDSSSPTLTNVTLSGNTASSGGGGIFNRINSNPKIYNTIILGNNTGVVNSSSTPDFRHSLVQDLTPPANDPNGNINPAGINASDIFVNPQAPGFSTAGDYSLKPTTAAVINKGDNALYDAVANAPTEDLAGNTRRVGAKIDLGAYEAPAFIQAATGNATLNIDAAGGSRAGLRLLSNVNFQVSIPSGSEWLTADKQNLTENDTITFTASVNPVNAERSVVVTFTETVSSPSGVKSAMPLLKAPAAPYSFTLSVIQAPGVTTGTDKVQHLHLSLYPNPVTRGIFTVEINADVRAAIYDVKGSLIKNLDLTAGRTTVEVGDLTEGIYMLRTQEGKQVKFVVK